jgi:calpain-7
LKSIICLIKKSSFSKEKTVGLEVQIKNALKRAEEIKLLAKKTSPSKKQEETLNETVLPTKHEDPYISSKRNSSFSQEELNVLRRGSFINDREYVPFLQHVDSKEKFYSPIPFSDKDGLLKLSSSQKEKFGSWARPDELFEDPNLIMIVSSFSIKQTCISDCSLVASLTVCAQFERKFGKKLLAP